MILEARHPSEPDENEDFRVALSNEGAKGSTTTRNRQMHVDHGSQTLLDLQSLGISEIADFRVENSPVIRRL